MLRALLSRWRSSRSPQPLDPLRAFDGLIEALERQAAASRRSAATLVALQGELRRAEARHAERRKELSSRIEEAQAAGEERVGRVLQADLEALAGLEAANEEALARAQADAELLLETAAELGRELQVLKEERISAAARLTAGGLVHAALRERVERFGHGLALEAARDEIERAHALAAIYREERRAVR